MGTILKWLGAALFIVGLAILGGYIVYLFSTVFFEADLPLVVKLAVPGIVVGVALLLIAAALNGARRGKTERLESSK